MTSGFIIEQVKKHHLVEVHRVTQINISIHSAHNRKHSYSDLGVVYAVQ